ncbi:sulfatase-like hydrolase/transferase, partial [candidate division KSB1 bacterium]|nr:sulfatase-like hydrolase/transferase [candidate division KSB1 bacterium]
ATPFIFRCDNSRSAKRPNIILYVTDDQGTTDAGCYGNPIVKTPGLDYLATKGVRFTHGFSTASSCSPSRATILTGLYSHANGQYGLYHSFHNFNSLPYITSLPALLAEAGYRTIISGKFHVGPASVYPFQHYINNYLAKGASYIPPDEAADLCKPHIEKHDSKPFFLYFCPKEPHFPFFREKADAIDPGDVIMPPYLNDTPENREKMAKYYMSIQQADQGLVRLIEILRQSNQWDNTVIMCCSDNGAPFPGAKTNLYDPGIRLPLVVRNPYSKKSGLVSNAMVSWADIAPTILEFAGVNTDNMQLHGHSFAGILEDDPPTGWDEIYASQTFHGVTFYYPMRAVRTRRYKLIWNVESGLDFPGATQLETIDDKKSLQLLKNRSNRAYINRSGFELYDLKDDPQEIENLVENQKYKSVFEELRIKLKSFLEKTNDPWYFKYPQAI